MGSGLQDLMFNCITKQPEAYSFTSNRSNGA